MKTRLAVVIAFGAVIALFIAVAGGQGDEHEFLTAFAKFLCILAALIALPFVALGAVRLILWWRRRTAHPWRNAALLVLAFLVLCGIALWLRSSPSRQAARLISRYRASPNQETAELMANLISFGNPPAEKGNEILRLLLDSRIAQSNSYPSGALIAVNVVPTQRLFSLDFYNYVGRLTETEFFDGKELGAGSGGGTGYFQYSSCDRLSSFGPQQPGVYNATIRINCKLWRSRGTVTRDYIRRPSIPRSLNRWISSPMVHSDGTETAGPPSYEATFGLPFTIKVVGNQDDGAKPPASH